MPRIVLSILHAFCGKFKMAASTHLHCIAFPFILLMPRRRHRMRNACRTTWSKIWIQRRGGRGTYANLLRELEVEDSETFRQYHHLDILSFRRVLSIVEPLIKKKDTVMQATISPG